MTRCEVGDSDTLPTPTDCAAPKLGGMAGEGCDLVLECAAGGKIASIEFADWGQPTAIGADPYDPAACEFQAAANCTAGPHIKSLVESLCVGKSRCTIATSDLNSPDPCSGHHKRVAVRASGCTPAKLPPAKPKTSFVSTTGGGTLGYCNSDTAGLSNGRPFIQNASSGPLPHSRWFGPYGSESEFVWEGNGTQIVSASAHPVIDDDCVGGITTDPRPANWCMEAVRGGNLEVWVAELSGHRLALALVNRSPKHATITAPWEAIGLLASKKMSVRDVWAAADKGTRSSRRRTSRATRSCSPSPHRKPMTSCRRPPPRKPRSLRTTSRARICKRFGPARPTRRQPRRWPHTDTADKPLSKHRRPLLPNQRMWPRNRRKVPSRRLWLRSWR